LLFCSLYTYLPHISLFSFPTRRSSDLIAALSMLLVTDIAPAAAPAGITLNGVRIGAKDVVALAKFYQSAFGMHEVQRIQTPQFLDRKSTRLNSSHVKISYAVFCLIIKM